MAMCSGFPKLIAVQSIRPSRWRWLRGRRLASSIGADKALPWCCAARRHYLTAIPVDPPFADLRADRVVGQGVLLPLNLAV